ncbi:hypothetical protein D3C78_1383220 [compost metagenome]
MNFNNVKKKTLLLAAEGLSATPIRENPSTACFGSDDVISGAPLLQSDVFSPALRQTLYRLLQVFLSGRHPIQNVDEVHSLRVLSACRGHPQAVPLEAHKLQRLLEPLPHGLR